MAKIKRLVETKELQTAFFEELQERGPAPILFNYDERFDALMFLFVSPDTETVAHYVDEHVALLYEPDSKQVVGMQIEDFEHSFVPQHESVRREWRLSGSAAELDSLGDIIFIVERQKPQVVREVVRATEDLIFRNDNELSVVHA